MLCVGEAQEKRKSCRSGLVSGKPRFVLLARVLPSFVSDCVTVQICVFQPERGVDECGELGKDKWRQRLLSAMAAGNPVNGALSFSLSHSRLHLSRALFPPACATVFILHSLVVRFFSPFELCDSIMTQQSGSAFILNVLFQSI